MHRGVDNFLEVGAEPAHFVRTHTHYNIIISVTVPPKGSPPLSACAYSGSKVYSNSQPNFKF